MGSASTERSPSRLCVPPGLSPRPLVSRAALSSTILCHPCARQAVERLLREGHERRDDDRLRRRKSAPSAHEPQAALRSYDQRRRRSVRTTGGSTR